MDLMSQAGRRLIIDEIESNENKARKAEHEKRFLVYNDHQRPFVLKMLSQEFSERTVREMRTCTSINLTKRIVDEMASIYKRKPEREFSNTTEEQVLGIKELYQAAKVDTYLKRANIKYKLHDQCALQVIPKEGKIALKLLAPHQYDVVPMPDDPEKAMAYIISSFDKELLESEHSGQQDIQGSYHGSKNAQKSDRVNQKIADDDDWRIARRYVVWTRESQFVMNGRGEVLSEAPNPIQELPFVDISSEKDFEFWIRKGSGVVDFNLDFSVVLSDTCNTNRLQSYAQPVIVAEKVPENVSVGPQNILFLPLDPTRPEVRPSFDFASPNPDLKASIDLLERLVNYFLTSRGISTTTVSGEANMEKFSSGLERLLAMIERFEASQSDLDLFMWVEKEIYRLIRQWYDALVGTDGLENKYNFGFWPEDAELKVSFASPEVIQTEADKEDSVIKRLDAGLISKTEAIAELRDISIEEAEKVAQGIDQPINMEA